jgi:uncharacterized membrane protein
MGKLEYLDALKRAMAGLPPDTVAKTLAYYEQRFIDGLAAGLSEAEIHAQLDEPRKIAMTLRANRHLNSFTQSKNPVNLARMLVSFIGLAIFNLFMLIPAMVYGCLLLAVYLSALTFYVSGIAVSASALSGQNELVLEGPLRHLIIDNDGDDEDLAQAKLAINEMGIQFYRDPKAASARPDDGSKPKLLERAEAVAGGGLHITTELDSGSRNTQAFVGLGLVLAGIGLTLVSVVVTRYTVLGAKRYAAMNFSLLRGR